MATFANPIRACDAETHPFFIHATDITSRVPGWKDGGLIWQQSQCIDSHLIGCFVDPCSDEEVAPEKLKACIPAKRICAYPFQIYAGVKNCDTETSEDLKALATEALDSDIGRRMAQALVKSFDGLANVATPLNGTAGPVSLANGLGLLQRNRKGCTCYAVPETLMPNLVMSGLVSYGSDGAPYMLGSPVIPVPTLCAPDDTTGNGIYAFGKVEYAIDPLGSAPRFRESVCMEQRPPDPEVEGDEGDEANDRIWIASRDALIRLDPCRVFYVEVTVPDC